jgi:hypothetical protein
MARQDKKAHIAEEAFMILHSGEIPEVYLHGSLYYLTEDPEGPGLDLQADDLFLLKQAVGKRYREIILRDLDPGNREKRIYRGLARCAANWQRWLKFCSRENLDFAAIQGETAEALQAFIKQEMAEVESRKRSSSINCSCREIENLAESLGISPDDLPEGWQELCPVNAEQDK